MTNIQSTFNPLKVVSSTNKKADLDDSSYLSSIAQYQDKPFYQYLLNNPWMGSKQGQFSPNLFQKIGNLFGDFSAEDNYYNTIGSNREQWLSEALERFRQEDYNSAISQVERQRAAGLNPDLNGSVDAGAAAENDQPILGHPQFGESVIPQVVSFFSGIYSLASGFAKDYFSLEQMSNSVKSGDLDISDKIAKATKEYISGRSWLGTSEAEDGTKGYSFNVNTDDLDSFARKMFNSRSLRKRFTSEVHRSINSSRGRFATFGSIKDAQDAKRALAQSIGENEAYGDNDFDPMISVYTNLNSAIKEITELQQNYSKDYFSEVSGSAAAKAENSNNESVVLNNEALSYQRKLDAIINRTMEKICSDLEKNANKGKGIDSLLSKGMLMFLSAFRLNLIPSAPSVNLKGLVDKRTMIFGDKE